MKKLALVLSVMTVVAGSVFAAGENFSFTTGEKILVAQATDQEYTVTVRITNSKDSRFNRSASYKVVASSDVAAEEKAKRMAAAEHPNGDNYTAISCSAERKSCYSR